MEVLRSAPGIKMRQRKIQTTYLLVAIDRFSRYPTVLITHKTTAKVIIKFLAEYIATQGVPKLI